MELILVGEDEIVKALIKAGANLDVGTPTARDAIKVFGKEEKYGPFLTDG